jgi:hypothetical protein
MLPKKNSKSRKENLTQFDFGFLGFFELMNWFLDVTRSW